MQILHLRIIRSLLLLCLSAAPGEATASGLEGGNNVAVDLPLEESRPGYVLMAADPMWFHIRKASLGLKRSLFLSNQVPASLLYASFDSHPSMIYVTITVALEDQVLQRALPEGPSSGQDHDKRLNYMAVSSEDSGANYGILTLDDQIIFILPVSQDNHVGEPLTLAEVWRLGDSLRLSSLTSTAKRSGPSLSKTIQRWRRRYAMFFNE